MDTAAYYRNQLLLLCNSLCKGLLTPTEFYMLEEELYNSLEGGS